MSTYEILRPEGDYPDRQNAANIWNADLYIEQHFNAIAYDKEADSDNYSLALCAHNASNRSKDIARFYADRAAELVNLPNAGVLVRGYRERGDYNLRFTDMPAFIAEPLFISDASQEAFAASEAGRDACARAVVDTVRWALPNGGRVALSTGHKYKSKYDPGAVGPGRKTEAELADAVMDRAAEMLSSSDTPLTIEERLRRLELEVFGV